MRTRIEEFKILQPTLEILEQMKLFAGCEYLPEPKCGLKLTFEILVYPAGCHRWPELHDQIK